MREGATRSRGLVSTSSRECPWWWAMLVVWAASRLLLLYYAPTINPDTGTYQLLADQIAGLDFSAYNGQRTPVYPLLILLAGNDYFVLWLFQSCMGLATALLVCLLVREHGLDRRWALAAGLVSLTALNLLFFEAAVFTETASAFLLAATTYLFIRFTRRGPGAQAATALGGLAALLVLTRPQYIFLIPLLPLLVILLRGRRDWLLALVLFVAASAPVVGWMAFNKQQVGYFTLTTLLGYNLSNHSGAFMEEAPEKYAQVRDIYLKYRQQKLAQTGSHHMTVFWAREELLGRTGLSEVELSRQLQRLSFELIRDHPGRYLRSVAKAWASFWAVPNYWELNKLKSRGLANALQGAWALQHPFFRAFNLIFVVASGLLFWQFLRRPTMARKKLAVPLILSCIVIGVSLVQALVEYGDNPRYYIPNQPLVVAGVLIAVADWLRHWRQGRKGWRAT